MWDWVLVRKSLNFRRYDSSLDEGPFFIIASFKDGKSANDDVIIAHLSKLNVTAKKISEIKVDKFKIELDSAKDANICLTAFSSNKSVAKFCLEHNIENHGVLMGIPSFYLNKYVDIPTRILSVRELVYAFWRIVGIHSFCIISQHITRIRFRCLHIPEVINILGENVKVKVVLPPVQICRQCLKYGHTETCCLNKVQRCPTCGKRKHDGKAPCFVYCISCGSDEHVTESEQCPIYKTRKQIMMRRTLDNKSYAELLCDFPCNVCNEHGHLGITSENCKKSLRRRRRTGTGKTSRCQDDTTPFLWRQDGAEVFSQKVFVQNVQVIDDDIQDVLGNEKGIFHFDKLKYLFSYADAVSSKIPVDTVRSNSYAIPDIVRSVVEHVFN